MARYVLVVGCLLLAVLARGQDGPPLIPLVATLDNQPIVVRVLVLNYDPFVPSADGRRLHDVLGFNDPRVLADGYRRWLEWASGGAVRFVIDEWRDLNQIYAQRDGYRYDPDEYVALRRSANPTWHDGGGQDYPRLLAEQGVPARIDAPADSDQRIDEVWIFGDHYFGLWEASMAGPGAFFINGGVYPEVPTRRPFAFYGFNYERGVTEMLHNTGHRTECHLNRVFGAWNLADPRNDWELFSANAHQSNGFAGVGTCHYPANGQADYDYTNPREVLSWAFAFLDYPTLVSRDRTSGLRPVSAETWTVTNAAGRRDPGLGYQAWYFSLLPRAPGTAADGRQNNWYKYIYRFNDYDTQGRPLPAAP